jgi:hypothetical protein
VYVYHPQPVADHILNNVTKVKHQIGVSSIPCLVIMFKKGKKSKVGKSKAKLTHDHTPKSLPQRGIEEHGKYV